MYGQLDGGVGPVEAVHLDGRAGQVGQEGVVTPVGEQSLLGGVGQSGAAHDQASAAVVALSDLGDPVGV